MTISAKVVADSVSPQGIRLTTLQLRYPKFIHSEFMTHRVFSRNASSSRAIPVERLTKDVIDDPVYPMHWGKNQPGMQADEECEEPVARCLMPMFGIVDQEGFTSKPMERSAAWDDLRSYTIRVAREYAKAGYHKQIVNRLLEPFCHINVVVTATEWSNFFALRCHPGAQPEMRVLAEAMRDAMAASTPNLLQPGEWHLPYFVGEGDTYAERVEYVGQDNAIKVSVARCARVSYLTQEGKEPSIEEDLKLYDRLVGAVPLHASPAEHQATPDTEIAGYERQGTRARWENESKHGNFCGWIQYRKTLDGECQ